MAACMSPLILSLPCMKAPVGSSSPAVIDSRSSSETLIVQSALICVCSAALFEGLTVSDPETLAPLPGVPERWELSEDGCRYTFHLRAATWSNGNCFRALTLLAARHCEQEGKKDFDPSVLTAENLAKWVGMLEFGDFSGQFDIRINGLGSHFFAK